MKAFLFVHFQSGQKIFTKKSIESKLNAFLYFFA